MSANGPTSEPTTMTGARYMAQTFQAYGLTHVFFVESTLRHMLAELEILGVRRIGARSEKGAAYMADGYARTRKGPAICMAQSVGAANLAAGLQDAYLGLSPVIALTGKKPPLAQYRNAYQEIDHMKMFEAVTKFNASVDLTAQLPYLLRQAFREATSGAPGPVHLDIGGGWGGQEVEDGMGEFTVFAEAPFMHYPSQRPIAADDLLIAAAGLLADAQRPVIVAGGGATMSGAGAELVALAELLEIPVATSLTGKNTIPEDHRLSLGIVGTYSRKCTNQVVSEADLVFYIGSSTGDQVTMDWNIPNATTPVIQLDILPNELGRSYPNAVSIAGDAQVSLRRLTSLIDADTAARSQAQHRSWSAHAAQIIQDGWAQIEAASTSDAEPIQVERLCRELTEQLPDDVILVADTGSAGIWTGSFMPLTKPGQRYLRAAGSLGWGYPAALGAKCAAPESPVVCFTGDGGFWYHLNEMETAKRNGINTVTVVNNNHAYGQCIAAVERAYAPFPGKPDGYSGRQEEIYGISETNFAALAESIGIQGIRVTDPRDLKSAIGEALHVDGPVIVDVVTDQASVAPVGWRPPAA